MLVHECKQVLVLSLADITYPISLSFSSRNSFVATSVFGETLMARKVVSTIREIYVRPKSRCYKTLFLRKSRISIFSPKMKQQKYVILDAINCFRVKFGIKIVFFSHFWARHQDRLFSISQFWGNLDFLQKSFITLTSWLGRKSRFLSKNALKH